jgi:hypothetical protein
LYFWCSLADLSYCYYFISDKIPRETYIESNYVTQQWNIYRTLQLSVKCLGHLCLYFCSVWKNAITVCIAIFVAFLFTTLWMFQTRLQVNMQAKHQHFNIQLMHTFKNNKMLKFTKITPTCFGSVDPSLLTTTIVSMHIVQ